MITRTSLILFALLSAAHALHAQPVEYEIGFPNRTHREAAVMVTWTNLPSAPLEVRMSRTSPGRYALHEFAKNVYRFTATDGAGRTLNVTRPNPHQWDIAGHDGTVHVSYTLFADRADGTYTGIDLSHAHLNMPATFMWARGTEDRPVTIRFDLPDDADWRIATQLRPTNDPEVFRAPHFQYFMDSPTEIADFGLRTWTVTSGTRTDTIRLAVHHPGTDAELDAFASMAQQVVAEQVAMWGEPPGFDFGVYTFIACYMPWASGDGMEHRNSTILTSTNPLSSAERNLGTLSHEFFHAWNVERLRPRTLEPFDFEHANMSDALWFAEGFTSYYDGLFLRRAGIWDNARFFSDLRNALNIVINSPGRQFFSPVEMSMQAPFVDAAVSIDPVNRDNTFISYYTWGSVIGLALDLSLRSRFDTTLDDFMRALWATYGRAQQNYTPARPYALEDLQQTLAQVSGDAAFAENFFTRFIRGGDVADYATLLESAGLVLRRISPGRATLGPVAVQPRGDRVVLTSRPLIGTPIYEAGLDLGDTLASIDGAAISDATQLQRRVDAHSPGDTVTIAFESRGVVRTVRTALAEASTLELVTFEDAGRPVTDAIRRFRTSWLGDVGDAERRDSGDDGLAERSYVWDEGLRHGHRE